MLQASGGEEDRVRKDRQGCLLLSVRCSMSSASRSRHYQDLYCDCPVAQAPNPFQWLATVMTDNRRPDVAHLQHQNGMCLSTSSYRCCTWPRRRMISGCEGTICGGLNTPRFPFFWKLFRRTDPLEIRVERERRPQTANDLAKSC